MNKKKGSFPAKVRLGIDFGQRNVPRPRGFLLLEAILLIVIVSVGMTAAIYALVQAHYATIFGRDYTEVMWLAESKMTELFSHGKVDSTMAQGGTMTASVPYHYELQIQKLPDQEKPTLYESKLTFSWLAGSNKKNFSVATFLPAGSEDSNK